MEYKNVVAATFLARPNRFLAECLVAGKTVMAHVKNTGRCKELLIPGVKVYLSYMPSHTRKTDYTLLSVQKGKMLVNIDSSAPNTILEEALRSGFILPGQKAIAQEIKREQTFFDSRLDFSFLAEDRLCYVETKGVTLEENGIALFPDAPTLRGIKHMKTLMHATEKGYGAYIIFIIQLRGVHCFMPNEKTHAAFGETLREAVRCGVHVLAYDTYVKPNQITFGEEIPVQLSYDV
ncbi:MAG: DNA/RNA nuclease SfsA [Christensenellaceae bacterium]|jgi:sugar fermentation stimulation protein A